MTDTWTAIDMHTIFVSVDGEFPISFARFYDANIDDGSGFGMEALDLARILVAILTTGEYRGGPISCEFHLHRVDEIPMLH